MPTRNAWLLALWCIVVLLAGSGCPPEPSPPLPPPPPQSNTFAPENISLTEVGSGFKKLADESLTYCDPGNNLWVAPKGTLTDGASVPRIALAITDGRFDHKFLKAAVVHDAYCQKENKTQCPDQYQREPWRDVHRMFYDACRAGGTSQKLAGTMYAFVWFFGPRWDDPASDLQTVSEELLSIGFDNVEIFIDHTEPTREGIEAWIDEREPAMREISEIESEWTAALDRNDQDAAKATLDRADEVLTRAFATTSPDDLMLLNLKGYHLNNRAEKLGELGRDTEAATELNKAEDTYNRIQTIKPQDPNADKGLERVRILRKEDLDGSEDRVHRKLAIDPDDPATKRNLEMIEARRLPPPTR